MSGALRIAVDMTACDAHGLCAELLPEVITLDEWGYPVIAARTIAEPLASLARRAVSVCPTLALRLEDEDGDGDGDGPGYPRLG